MLATFLQNFFMKAEHN